jgi:replication initiation protein RepC
MKQDHQTAFGRHNTVVPASPSTSRDDSELLDKWKLLAALTDAADDFGLNHRNISVLRALMGFYPDRSIGTARHCAIVFPANRTLSARLGGMPESTLRRHIAVLVEAGIVSRHDSANRKRFARGRGRDTSVAFGFDLSPLARLATRIIARAEQAAETRAHLQALRAQLGALRQSLIAQDGDTQVTQNAFRILRRKPDAATLTPAIAQLTALLNADEMSVSDSQNERHIQGDSKIFTEAPVSKKIQQEDDGTSLDAIVETCTEYQALFPEAAHNWPSLSRVAYALAPMMGIERPVYAEAIDVMGPRRAIAVVLLMLEGLATIGNPGGYFRTLTQQCRAGEMNISVLAQRLTPKSNYCQLTT